MFYIKIIKIGFIFKIVIINHQIAIKINTLKKIGKIFFDQFSKLNYKIT